MKHQLSYGSLQEKREIWRCKERPKDWCRGMFMPIYKKWNVKECSNYRTINLMIHASKVLACWHGPMSQESNWNIYPRSMRNNLALWMQKMGFPVHVIELLEHMYKNQEAAVNTSCGTSEWFSIERGVRQGCIVSHSLFNIYSENIMREATENTSAGITIGGRKIN